jgi:uncharacterized Zn-binding protein involved in type VI secretion
MIPIARQTDLHACPILIHAITPIVPIGGTVYVNGIPIARVGDMTGCGAVIVSGFPQTISLPRDNGKICSVNVGI